MGLPSFRQVAQTVERQRETLKGEGSRPSLPAIVCVRLVVQIQHGPRQTHRGSGTLPDSGPGQARPLPHRGSWLRKQLTGRRAAAPEGPATGISMKPATLRRRRSRQTAKAHRLREQEAAREAAFTASLLHSQETFHLSTEHRAQAEREAHEEVARRQFLARLQRSLC